MVSPKFSSDLHRLKASQAPELLREHKEDSPPVTRNKHTDVYALGMVSGPARY